MRRPTPCVLLALALLFCAFPVYAFDVPHLWSQVHGSESGDAAQAIAVDANGNVFVTGFFSGTANFGGSDIINPGVSYIMYIAKYNAAGVHQWSRGYGGMNTASGMGIKADGAGNVIVTGHFTGTLDFLVGGPPLVSAGNDDIFLVKFNGDGVVQWSQRFGSTGDDWGLALAVDAANNIYVTGYFNGIVNFGGVNYASAGLEDVFLAKYNSIGVHQWSRRFGGAGSDAGRGLAVDGAGNLFMTGSFAGNVDFGGGALVNAGSLDIVLAKYSTVAGAHIWSKRFGNASDDYGTSVAVNALGHVFVTGWFTTSVNFGGGVLASVGLTDTYLARFDGVGTHVWSQRFGSTLDDGSLSVTVDPSSNVTMTGYISGAANFGGGSLPNFGGYDAFIANYDGNGVHRWSRRAGSYYNDVGFGVGADASSNVFVTGYFHYQANFGGNNLIALGPSNNTFIAKFGGTSTEPVIASITDIGNDQGRKVKIVFSRSGQDDAAAGLPVKSYEAYREIAAPPSPAAGANGPQLDAGWTHVGTVAAHAKGEYSIDAPTIGDSTIALGQYLSTFFIRAATDEPEIHFDSTPDDGYSVDNLAPGVPDNLILGGGDLSWDESEDEDFDYFTVYGSTTDSFDDAVLIDYTIGTNLDVSTSPYLCYFVTATDFSGNESKAAKLNSLSGAGGGTPSSYVLSVSNFPNPFNPGTTVKYTVPAAGRVSATVYDARGARVVTLVDREHARGAYSVEWNGQAKGSPVSSGIYFARIEHAGSTRSKKMLLLK